MHSPIYIGMVFLYASLNDQLYEQNYQGINCRLRRQKTGRWMYQYHYCIFNNMVGTR